MSLIVFVLFFVKEKLKERELREQMERELRAKEQQLTDVTKRQSDLEMKLLRLNLNETETKSDNDRLQKVLIIFFYFLLIFISIL